MSTKSNDRGLRTILSNRDFNVHYAQPTESFERYFLTGTSMSTKDNRQKLENDTF